MNDQVILAIQQRLSTADRIVVISHIRPDGDAIGSLLGLGLALKEVGKQVQMVMLDGVPSSLRHLQGSDQVKDRVVGSVDLAVIVDCSDLSRVGSSLNGYGMPDINIDHHVTNVNFARLNLVQPAAVATAQILAESLAGWDLPLTKPVAEALLTGLITDTIGFRTSNMNPSVLRLAALLMEAGADLPNLYNRALNLKSFNAVRFWGEGLSQIERKGQLVWTTLSLENRKAAGYSGRDDADLINVLSSIDDAAIAVIFVEQNSEIVKVSWRAQPGYDVSQIALGFGGGGHPAASGAEIQGSLEQVCNLVLQETFQLLSHHSVQQ